MFERPAGGNQENRETEDLVRVMERIQQSGLFDDAYLKQVKLVLYGKKDTRVFEGGTFQPSNRELFPMNDFMSGRRTDFVGIHPRAEFEALDYAKIPDRKALPLMFVGGRLSFEQLVAHELAHNTFDIRYQQAYGPYEEHDGVTDVSETYRRNIQERLRAVVGELLPGIDTEHFTWTRQQIAEISAFLAEREACRRLGVHEAAQAAVAEKVAQFLASPEEVLALFNSEEGRKCRLDDMYTDNHVLSIMLAPAIEQKCPEYVDRQAIFFGHPTERKEQDAEVMRVPEIDSRVEWDVQLCSMLFTLENTNWGSMEHPLAQEVRRYFLEHPIPREILQDWQTMFGDLGADEESVQNLALAYRHPERKGDVLRMIAEHKPGITDVGRMQETLYSTLERFDAIFSSSELAEKFRTALVADQQARLQRREETKKMLGALIDFFRPDQATTRVKTVNFVPTDTLRRANSGWAFQSGEELTIVSHIENLGNQEHEFLHCVINPIVEKLRGRLTEEQRMKISMLASPTLRADYGEGWESLLCEELIRSYNDVFQYGGAIETYEDFQCKIAELSEEQFQVGLAEQEIFRKQCTELGIRTVMDLREHSKELYEGRERNLLRDFVLKLYQDYADRSDKKMNFETYLLKNFMHRI